MFQGLALFCQPRFIAFIHSKHPSNQGTVANKFYVHNDIFRYQDEVFGDSDSEPPEGEPLANYFKLHA